MPHTCNKSVVPPHRSRYTRWEACMDTSPDKLPRACERLRMDAIEKKEYTSTINPIFAIKSEENVGSKKEHKNILKTLTLESGDDTAESNGNHSAGFRRRVTLGQQGMAACSGIATSFYVLAISTNMEIFRTLTTVFIFSIIVFTLWFCTKMYLRLFC